MPITESRIFGHLLRLAFVILWVQTLFPVVSTEDLPYLEPGFLFDWYGDQSPPIPTAAQCDTLHITWGRRSATGPNPVAPYFLQIYTSTFTVPFVIPAGDSLATSFDWVVPFTPGTQFQMCMVASNGVTGGCQNIYTVYQRPNTTLNNPPSCFNLTYPYVALDVEASLSPAKEWAQYGWVDQCSEISLKPTNGTPPFWYSIAPALHPPFNFTSNNTDSFIWTVSLMYGMPFFVTVSDANGVGWSNGPLHLTGAGSTSCLDLNAGVLSDPNSTSHAPGISPGSNATECIGPGGSPPGSGGNSQGCTSSGGISAGREAGIAIGAVFIGTLIGLLGSYLLARWKLKNRSTSHNPAHVLKLPGQGDTPTMSQYPPSSDIPTALGRSEQRGGHADECGFLPVSAVNPRLSQNQPTLSPGREDGAVPHMHQPSPYAISSTVPPTGPSMPSRSLGGLVQNSTSHVYVVHHDAGRPPPVTVFTSDGTEVVELPPRYETAERRDEQERELQEQGRGASNVRLLPASPPISDSRRRAPRSLPPKP